VRARVESWGAWVRLEEPPALVALDHEGARAIGIEGGDVWSSIAVKSSSPLEAHVAVTSQCGVGCEGCYLDATPDGAHVPRARLEATLDRLADDGVFTVAFGGGEPILRDDLGELATYARARGLMPVVTTSGIGLTRAKAESLRAFAQVNVSYEADRNLERVERAMCLLKEANVPFGVNVVLTRESFSSIEATLERARELGAREAQLLRYKPAGRAAKLDYVGKRLSRAQVAELGATVERIACRMQPLGFRLRIDCAMVALLSDVLHDRASDLQRLGVFGCEAGASLCAIRADGQTAPCSFLDVGDVAPSGSSAPCAGCKLASVCRGGCRAVARFVDGHDGPDPECPRVVRHREGAC
jgi:MoaA/NifB/PqqE/SkfB family radical SAM enzyme